MATDKITIETKVNAPVEKAWKAYNEPKHVTQWNHASDDWHSPRAENDLRTGGRFNYRMEAKDGSFGFDFGGTYNDVKENELIKYTMDDGRKVDVVFTPTGNSTKLTVAFEPESENPLDMQRGGWQAILDNYKKYTETIN